MKKYVIRGKSYQFTSTEIGNQGEEETYDSYEEAERHLEQLQTVIKEKLEIVEKE